MTGSLHPEQSGLELAQVVADLEESEQRLSAVFSGAQIGILVVEAETRTIVDANPKAVEIMEGTREGIVGSV